jgi:hypothetical protein
MSNPMKVRKTTFEEELVQKEAYFLSLTPEERLEQHEELLKRIWGDKYSKVPLAGQKVHKKVSH